MTSCMTSSTSRALRYTLRAARMSGCRILSLHVALPISHGDVARLAGGDRDNHIGKRRPRVLEIVLRSEEHTSELQSHSDIVCRLLREKKKDEGATSDGFLSLHLQARILRSCCLHAIRSH